MHIYTCYSQRNQQDHIKTQNRASVLDGEGRSICVLTYITAGQDFLIHNDQMMRHFGLDRSGLRASSGFATPSQHNISLHVKKILGRPTPLTCL